MNEDNKLVRNFVIFIIVSFMIGLVVGATIIHNNDTDYLAKNRQAMWECTNTLIKGGESTNDSLDLIDGVRVYYLQHTDWSAQHNYTLHTWMNMATAVKFGNKDNCRKVMTYNNPILN